MRTLKHIVYVTVASLLGVAAVVVIDRGLAAAGAQSLAVFPYASAGNHAVTALIIAVLAAPVLALGRLQFRRRVVVTALVSLIPPTVLLLLLLNYRPDQVSSTQSLGMFIWFGAAGLLTALLWRVLVKRFDGVMQ